MAKQPILLLLLAAVLLWAPDLSAQQDKRKRGDSRKHGRAVTRTYDTGDFTQLDISGAWKVVLRQGNRHHVEIKTHSDLHDLVQADVRQGVLHIRFSRSVKHADVRIAYITVPELEGIRVHGASEVEIESNLRASELRLSAHGAARITGDLDAEVLICDLSGASQIILTGRSDNLALELSGASRFKGDDFKAKTGIIDASGASSARVHLTRELRAEASGASSISCTGKPGKTRIEKHGASSVSVSR
ncbi:MAG: head GIN domain-containing protein [Bacteroidia bacterium]|nr:head GIN domain-containing protein [Bacteroidia bacterium]